MIPIAVNRHCGALASPGGEPEQRVLIASCAADIYRPPAREPAEPETPPANRNGFLVADRLWIGRYAGEATAGAGEEAETRPVVIVGQSQFWYHRVRLLGQYVGHDAPNSGGDTLPVYAATVCFGCLTAADYFQREEPGEDWDQASGTAAIDDGKLVTSDPDARFWYWQAKPSRPFPAANFTSEVMSVLVTLSSDSVGSEASVLQHDLSGSLTSVSWRFEDGQGRLVVRNIDAGGTESLPSHPGPFPVYDDDVGSTFLFPGLGAGTPVTLRFCRMGSNRFNVHILQPDGRWWPARLAFGYLGVFGLGSRDVAGQVRFSNFELDFGPGAPALAHCVTCQECHACADDQQLCLVYLDEGNVPQQEVLSRKDATFSCGWEGAPFFADLIHQANGLWIIRVLQSSALPPITGRWFVALLGEEVPRCDDWHCVPLFELEDAAGGTWPETLWDEETLAEEGTLSGWSISSGDECLYDCGGGGTDPCCGEVTLPLTLYLSGTRDGTPIQTDLPLDGEQNPPGNTGGFEYESNEFDPEHYGYVVCIGSLPNGHPDKVNVSIFDPDESETVNLNVSVLSCDPFYATGSREWPSGSGQIYSVEIYE